LSNYQFDTLLEIGCGSGANLIRIRQNYKDLSIFGIDYNNKAIDYFNNKFSNLKIFASSMDLFNLKGKFDIILTDACLMYHNKKSLDIIVSKINDIANKAIILCEWHDNNGSFTFNGHWVHNYKDFYKDCEIHKLGSEYYAGDIGWEKYGNIMEVNLERKRSQRTNR
jgi:SAM-dependent methyltransferase